MNRMTDFLVSFSVALLLHGVLVLGAVWFWTLRSPELRPIFQSGDNSLAVTFVAPAAEGGGRRTDDRGRTAEEREEKTDDGRRTTDINDRKPETADILTDPETEMTDDGLPADLSAVASGAKVEAPGAKAGRQRMDSAFEPSPEEVGDQKSLDPEDTPQVSASVKAPVVGSRNLNQGLESADASGDALRQGVSGAVRMQSEIRPYYPLGARLRGEEGIVTVRVWVNASGRTRRCEVAHSSGYPALDKAAVDAARRARYVSTRPGAWRAEAETTLTFRFRLTE